jgi:hypothetical protein
MYIACFVNFCLVSLLRLAYFLFAVLLHARLVGMIFHPGHLPKQSSATAVAHRTSQMMMMMRRSTSQNEQILLVVNEQRT